MIPFDLRVDLATGEPVISVDDLSIAGVPHFVEGLSLDLRIWGIKKSAGVASYIPVSDFTVFVAVGNLLTDTPTYFTQQATWTASPDSNNPYYEAVLPMNTSGISTLVRPGGTGVRSAKADFGVFFFVSGAPAGALIKSVKVYKTLYSTASLIVPAGQTPLSAEAADVAFLKRTIIGPVIFVNETDPTKRNLVYTDTDGSFKADPV